jgi:3-oxoacyl-[acyl-carrier protein] reductase
MAMVDGINPGKTNNFFPLIFTKTSDNRMDLNLKGKRAVVCGSTQGIGKATAIELALLGASITLLARQETKLKETVKELSTHAGQTHDYLVADFNFPAQVKQAIVGFGTGREAHILINNTGGPPAGQAIDAQPEDFIKALTSHLICSQLLVQAIVPGMKRNSYGRIVNIISTSVKIPIKGLGVSNTVRGAMANWSKTLSLELASFGITVNNVLPGGTKTGRIESIIQTRASQSGRSPDEIRNEMIAEIPAGRMAEASEVAAVVAFLATPAAGYINGVSLAVDGGRTGSL